MRPNHTTIVESHHTRRMDGLGLWLAWAVLVPGCAETINPFQDDLPDTRQVTTASKDRVLEAHIMAAEAHRNWPDRTARAQNQGVSHWPLWWSDALEDSGSDDGRFAWTGLDYAAFLYCPTRQIVNTAGLPLSLIAAPPGSVMCSDGLISQQRCGAADHDTTPCTGVPIPPDIIEAYDRSQTPSAAP